MQEGGKDDLGQPGQSLGRVEPAHPRPFCPFVSLPFFFGPDMSVLIPLCFPHPEFTYEGILQVTRWSSPHA